MTLTLPPPQYARKGGEIVAAQLAKVGINAKIENVEWAQWLSGPFKGNFDLTIILHVEPLDYATAYADPNYYFGYDSAKFRGLVDQLASTTDAREKARLWQAIQRQLADDAVNVYIWNPIQAAVFRKGLKGLWNSSPIFANDSPSSLPRCEASPGSRRAAPGWSRSPPAAARSRPPADAGAGRVPAGAARQAVPGRRAGAAA